MLHFFILYRYVFNVILISYLFNIIISSSILTLSRFVIFNPLREKVVMQTLNKFELCYPILAGWDKKLNLLTIQLQTPSSGCKGQLQSRSTRPESCHRTPDWGRLQPAEYRLAVWLHVCSSVSDKWPHRLSQPAATQQPAYSIRQQQSSAPVRTSTCWHCWKRDCRQTGKGSSKTPPTSLLHHIQRSQDPSETEAEISLEIKKKPTTMDMTHRKTRLTLLTGGPKPPSSVCVLVTVG